MTQQNAITQRQYTFTQNFMFSHVVPVIVFSLRKVVISEIGMKMVFELGTWASANLKTQNIRKKNFFRPALSPNHINSKKFSDSVPVAWTQVEIHFSLLWVEQKWF